jgi:hypothetical protein
MGAAYPVLLGWPWDARHFERTKFREAAFKISLDWSQRMSSPGLACTAGLESCWRVW